MIDKLAATLTKIRAGRHEEALAELEALQADPALRPLALGHRAWLNRSLGRFGDALRDYDALLAVTPDDLYGATLRAETQLLAGQPRDAATAAAAILARDPLHGEATRVLLESRRALGLNYGRGPVGSGDLPAGVTIAQAKSCPTPRFTLPQVIKNKLRFPSRYNYYEHYIRTHAKGRRFLDIGAMWLVDGRFSFFAEEVGAVEVVAFDIFAPTAEFRRQCEQRNSRVRFVQGDLMDPDCLASLGTFDVVFCSGVLYHLPDPILGLQRIRALVADQAMIGTAVIAEGLSKNRAVYYPYMDGRSRRRWQYKSEQAKLGLDGDYRPAEGYGNWFWGTSPSCVASLALTAGLRPDHIHYRRHFAYFECTAIS